MPAFFHVLRKFFLYFLDTECFTRASALAFTTVLALVPLMVVALSIFSFLPISQNIQLQIQAFIFSNFVATSSQTILHYLQLFVAHAHQLSWISLCFLMVTALSMLFSLESSLNVIWHVKTPRHIIKALFFYLMILIITPIFLALSITSSFIVSHRIDLLFNASFSIKKWLPFTFSFIAYLLVYKILPHCHVPWKSAGLSALLSATLFEAAKFGFSWYLMLFPTYTIIYGAIAAFPIFVIWVYICWVIFFLGACAGSLLALSKPFST